MKMPLKNRLANLSVWAFLTYTLIDANNILLHAKMIFFVITLAFLFLNYAFRLPDKIVRFLLFIVFWSFFTYGMGRVYGYEVDNAFFIQFLLTYSMLILLGWHKYVDFYNKLWLPCLFLSFGTIILYVMMQYDPTLYEILHAFGTTESGTPTIYISDRTFLGFQFYGVFYTPLILCTIPASTYMYRSLFIDKDKNKNVIMSLIFIVALFCAGNRAGLMSCLIIPVFLIILKLRRRHKIAYRFFICSFLLSMSLLVFALVTEDDDKSNNVKNGHIDTYLFLLRDRPEAFLTGMGPGSMVYSKGFGEKTTLMEWTYIELFRMYGVGGLSVLIFFWFPTYYVWKNRMKYIEGIPFVVGSSVFLLASATNPYLLNSTGMIYLVMSYSYMYNMRIVLNKKGSSPI